MNGVPDGNADHPKAEDAHGRRFGEGRHGSVTQGHAHDKQADGVVTRIAEKVECVGLQRGRARGEASTNLHREHGGVNGQHEP